MGPFAYLMDLGERKTPASISAIENLSRYVEGRNDARIKLADFFSILPALRATYGFGWINGAGADSFLPQFVAVTQRATSCAGAGTL